VLALTADPSDPTSLWLLDEKTPGAQAIESFTNAGAAMMTQDVLADPMLGFHSIGSAPIPGGIGIVWTAKNGSIDGYYTRNIISDGGVPALFGPVTCPCSALHAVPNPVDNASVFLLCDPGSAHSRKVYAVFMPAPGNTQGTCGMLLDEGTLDTRYQITHLGLALQ
jgi:hypothetical protein